jgi:hypothetical protein
MALVGIIGRRRRALSPKGPKIVGFHARRAATIASVNASVDSEAELHRCWRGCKQVSCSVAWRSLRLSGNLV